jgi:hypothetical protein
MELVQMKINWNRFADVVARWAMPVLMAYIIITMVLLASAIFRAAQYLI